ncbi:hypothetical protein CAPTEDRAFT_224632 [Capitella teleta]|uniref:Uncharacterized protein n=1 Tax=Capitella teleta TaxID=283909 RepID=R7TWT1_CAPTE|nr:hypothetical protein CAPTEDRAFT_224632 [Capitella teleta]|eukprot:ELT98067.1 hypothetical protein CAPTEDRAFT_224632 [Capitella teleta]
MITCVLGNAHCMLCHRPPHWSFRLRKEPPRNPPPRKLLPKSLPRILHRSRQLVRRRNTYLQSRSQPFKGLLRMA